MGVFDSTLVKLGAIGLLAAVGYEGAHYMLGNPEDRIVRCNDAIQAFDMDATPVYWQVFEGVCYGADLNFERVRLQIESMLTELSEENTRWPRGECAYAQLGDEGYVWSYGTDYHKVAELDCLEPLRGLQKEKEENLDMGEWIKGLFTQRTDISSFLARLF